MAFNLSAKQFEVLCQLRAFALEHGYMPSIRELARVRGSAVATARQYIDLLKDRGWLTSDGTAHGLRFQPDRLAALERFLEGRNCHEGRAGGRDVHSLSPPGGAASEAGVSVPVVGCISAGRPLEAIEVEGGAVIVPRAVARPGAFALRVRGDSMVEDHILDGDLVIVAPQSHVADGDVAVAVLEDGTATLKRIYREKGRVRLQPANTTMRPLYVTRVTVQGRVTGIMRLVR